MKFPFIKDTSGKESASLTLSIAAFLLVSTWFLLSFLGIKFGSWSVREFSEGAAMSYLIPCLTLYWGRRFTDLKKETQQPPSDKE